MRTGTAFALLLAAFFSIATAEPAPRFYFNYGAGRIHKETPLTIYCPSDVSGIKEELQIMLQQSGFQIYSAIAAKTTATVQGASYRTVEQGVGYGSVNTLDQSQREYTQENRNYVQQTYQQYGTENLITLRYVLQTDKNGALYVDSQGRMYVTSFSAEIASKETGAIMMSIQYPHYPRGYDKTKLLKDLVGRLRLCTDQGLCDEQSQQPRTTSNGGGGGILALLVIVGLVALVVAAN